MKSWQHNKVLYLDHAASSPIHPSYLQSYFQFLKEDIANPAARHFLGKAQEEMISTSYHSLLKTLTGTKNNRQAALVLTSSGTEANNQVISFIQNEIIGEVIYFKSDHASITQCFSGDESGRIALSHLNDLFTDKNIVKDEMVDVVKKCGAIVLTEVNGQTGEILDIARAASSLKSIKPDLYIHVDGVQSFGKTRVSLSGLGIDSYAISLHKIAGPKGIGLLYLANQDEIKMSALLKGGGQQKGLRSSTESSSSWRICEKVVSGCVDTLKQLEAAQKYQQQLLSYISSDFFAGNIFHTSRERSPYILCLILKKWPSDVFLRHLEQIGVVASSSSACTSRLKKINPQFEALGIQKENHKNVLRFSFSPLSSTLKEDYLQAELAIKEVSSQLDFLN